VNNTEHGISRKIDNVGTITSARQVANELIGSSSIINAPKTPKHLRHEITQPSGITPKDIVASTTHGKQWKIRSDKFSCSSTRADNDETLGPVVLHLASPTAPGNPETAPRNTRKPKERCNQ
jgi:hypothetical protein